MPNPEIVMTVEHTNGVPGPCTNIDTGVTTPAGEPLPAATHLYAPGATPLAPIEGA